MLINKIEQVFIESIECTTMPSPMGIENKVEAKIPMNFQTPI
jgi:hypothetical protein